MSQSFSFDGYVILMVEDDPLIGIDLAMRLEEAGAVIIGPFRSAQAALSALNDTQGNPRPHVAILDVDLGNHTSEEVARELQTINVPIVFYTAQASADEVIYDGVTGAVVRKPDLGHQLFQAVAKALTRVHDGDPGK